ncbi:Hypothetical protein PHPALM_8560 [Phytophthora palmivora]|uniref:Uncharacterized protein n=1 Tax=Phytophthora palmivora TaxID=4796 RepID=A0A2P4Y9I6_9STRA|nr:Hypothetical protein PHPALM_8560 [Phytophthora palmivora]
MVDKIEEDEVIHRVPLLRVGIARRFLLVCRDFLTGVTVIPTFVLVVLGLFVFGLVMETHVISCMPQVGVLNEEICSPRVQNASMIEYHSGHRYYTALKELDPPTAPTFRGQHTELCDEELRTKAKFSYCLPISGRKDTPFCTAGDRTDLLHVRSPKSVCYSSVLHMLLVEVYEELQASGNTPLVTFGSLLGAVRNGSMIPFTEDTDIGFVGYLNAKHILEHELWQKGYHMFFLDIWRVCVAPTHPLASRLYDPSLPLTKNYAVPYVDLYQMRKLNNGYWDIQELQGSIGRLMPYDRVEPFSQVTINGMPFNTVHDPQYFLTEAYGADYMTPKHRDPPSVQTVTNQLKQAASRLTKGGDYEIGLMDKKLEEGDQVVKHAPPRRVGVVRRVFMACRDFWTGVTVIPTFVVVLAGLTLFGFAMETHILACMPEFSVFTQDGICMSRVLNVSAIEYHSGHRFYSVLKERGTPTPLTFRGNHTKLCEETQRTKMKYGYCLPINGRKDTPFCLAGD